MPRLPRLDFGRRTQAIVGASALTGVLVGLAVAGFERLTDEVLIHALLEQPLWVQMLAPGIGLAFAALSLRYLAAGASPATADEYVRSYHESGRRMPLRPVFGRLVAGVATLGSGGAMGLEGPSIYAGAAIGTSVQGRLARLFARDETKLLLVAGAAAGVSAVFKAPATGVIFALEVPYTDDVARRALIPSLVASATSYLVFVSVVGTEPLLPRFGVGPDFGLLDLGGALLLGILAGGGARMFAALMHRAKRLSGSLPAWQRVLGAGLGLAALALLTDVVYDAPLSLGPGYQVVTWVGQAQEEIALVALLFAIRLAATTLTVGGGGAGGLFIPLVIQGLLLGRLVGNVVGDPASGLFPVIGIAAFLGAGYRTPIASVMFVAETTGLATYVVPALVAAAVSQLTMGRSSVSPVQVSARLGHLERRFRLPISSAISTDVLTVPPDASVSEFVWVHALGRRQRTVPVVEGARYLGMCDLDRAAEVPREEWDTTTVADIMRSDLPVGQPAWTLRDVVAAMEEAAVDQLPVADGSGSFVGVVSNAEILKLDEILDETGG